MPTPYALLYRIGFTPWEDSDDRGPLLQLLANRPVGRALDTGCGSGRQTVLMAEHGWHVTGVDAVARPLRVARARALAAGVDERVHLVRADVTSLGDLPGAPFDLVTDVGCLHGLSDAGRRSFTTWLTEHTASGADLLLSAALPRRGLGPRGIDEAELTGLLGPVWSLVEVSTPEGVGHGPLAKAAFRWYHYRRD